MNISDPKDKYIFVEFDGERVAMVFSRTPLDDMSCYQSLENILLERPYGLETKKWKWGEYHTSTGLFGKNVHLEGIDFEELATEADRFLYLSLDMEKLI